MKLSLLKLNSLIRIRYLMAWLLCTLRSLLPWVQGHHTPNCDMDSSPVQLDHYSCCAWLWTVKTETVCWLQICLHWTFLSSKGSKSHRFSSHSALAQNGVNGERCWLPPSTSLSWLTSWKWWMTRPASWCRSWRSRQGRLHSTASTMSPSAPSTSFVVGEINAHVFLFVHGRVRVFARL